MIEKNDGSLRTMIKETISVMKEGLLESVIDRIELLDSKIFDKEHENDNLKSSK